MTTTVIVKVPEAQEHTVGVAIVSHLESASGTDSSKVDHIVRLPPGQSREFHLFREQSLYIVEEPGRTEQ